MYFYPSIEEVNHFKLSHSLIPISCKVWSDNVTPIRLFQLIKGKHSFLLESVEGGEKWARYSFIGNKPFLIFSTRHGVTKIERLAQGDIVETITLTGDPLTHLKALLKQYQTPKDLNLPRFTGGAVGYFGYDAVSLIEEVPDHQMERLKQDQIRLMFCDEIIAFDHLQQEITFISHLDTSSLSSVQEVEREYKQICQKLKRRVEELLQKLQRDTLSIFQLPENKHEVNWAEVESNFTSAEFMAAVKQVQEYIRAGDVFQTVLSQRFTLPLKTEPFNLYRLLRLINPSPYLYYLDLGDHYQLVGSSPERLVQVEEGRVETNPIAGTRARGKSAAEDEQLAQELLADEKERAEHHMLLDLGRNDIGRVSKYGSVQVKKKMIIEKFSHVMHIVSTVQGQLNENQDGLDCLLSCFPAGTVSGAPKIRAMEIIAELEKEARHAYAGAIGYFSFSGNLDSCITIRTVVVHQGQAYIQAGAGIVADSLPQNEWEETRNKAKALILAVQLANQVFEEKGKGEVIHA